MHLLLIPGLLNDEDLWSDQIKELNSIAKCNVLDITRGNSLEEIAADALRNAPEKFALAGFSLGGFVAIEMARQQPWRIDRLALIDTSIKADSQEQLKHRRSLNKLAAAPGYFHGFGDKFIDRYVDPTNRHNPDIISRIRNMTARLGSDIFVRQNSLRRKDGAAVLGSLSCPILIACGENDEITPLNDHIVMSEIAKDSQLIVIKNAGHMTPIEQPQQLTEALIKWLTT
jgi:pimeloyl-ACP methyl ester carboxylesterase